MSAIIHLLHLVKADAHCAEETGYVSDANYLWKVGAYVCVLTALSFQGHEGFYVELAGLRKHLSKGKTGAIHWSIDHQGGRFVGGGVFKPASCHGGIAGSF
jgi:hypothetical protein